MNPSPFAASSCRAGHGSVILAILPPSTLVLETLSYQYPLKLIAPNPLHLPYPSTADRSVPANGPAIVHTVFLLTYGGGLVAGDEIVLDIQIPLASRLVLLTQGSTKIFKSPSPNVTTRQCMTAVLEHDASLLYLPEPVQPFELSCFEQKQIYEIRSANANLCICDWVCEGRPARGEHWSFTRYISRNEIWNVRPGHAAQPRLALRDNLILDNDANSNSNVYSRMHGLGVFGTLILGGSLFASLADFFLQEFKSLPRIGARQWDFVRDDGEDVDSDQDLSIKQQRASRLAQEASDGLLWTASATRGFVVVKFGAREVQGAKRWLLTMLKAEGTVERCFGDRALMCLR